MRYGDVVAKAKPEGILIKCNIYITWYSNVPTIYWVHMDRRKHDNRYILSHIGL